VVLFPIPARASNAIRVTKPVLQDFEGKLACQPIEDSNRFITYWLTMTVSVTVLNQGKPRQAFFRRGLKVSDGSCELAIHRHQWRVRSDAEGLLRGLQSVHNGDITVVGAGSSKPTCTHDVLDLYLEGDGATIYSFHVKPINIACL